MAESIKKIKKDVLAGLKRINREQNKTLNNLFPDGIENYSDEEAGRRFKEHFKKQRDKKIDDFSNEVIVLCKKNGSEKEIELKKEIIKKLDRIIGAQS